MSNREPLSEDELRDLLKVNDGPVVLSGDQRRSLRRRVLPNPVALPVLGEADQVTDISALCIGSRRSRRRRSLRRAFVAAALAILVAAAGIATFGGGDRQEQLQTADDETAVFPTVLPAPEPLGVTFCRDSYGPLVEAIRIWDGIDGWIFLLDRRLPEPDLAIVAQQAVNAALEFDTTGEFNDIARRLGDLRDGVTPTAPTSSPQVWSAGEIEEHRSAVSEAVQQLERLVERNRWDVHPGCESSQ